MPRCHPTRCPRAGHPVQQRRRRHQRPHVRSVAQADDEAPPRVRGRPSRLRASGWHDRDASHHRHLSAGGARRPVRAGPGDPAVRRAAGGGPGDQDLARPGDAGLGGGGRFRFEFRYSGRPLASLQGLDDAGRVIYVETFSKVLFPGLRLGYAVMPTPLIHVFQAARFLADRFAPTLLQAALCEFIPRGLRHAVLTAKYRSQAPYSGSSFEFIPRGLRHAVLTAKYRVRRPTAAAPSASPRRSGR